MRGTMSPLGGNPRPSRAERKSESGNKVIEISFIGSSGLLPSIASLENLANTIAS
jgi:hypothetical protein